MSSKNVSKSHKILSKEFLKYIFRGNLSAGVSLDAFNSCYSTPGYFSFFTVFQFNGSLGVPKIFPPHSVQLATSVLEFLLSREICDRSCENSSKCTVTSCYSCQNNFLFDLYQLMTSRKAVQLIAEYHCTGQWGET